VTTEPATQSIDVRVDLKIGDVYNVYFSSALWKLMYGRWILAIVFIFLLALGTFGAAAVVPLVPFLIAPLLTSS
jgi:hypothetical protein